MFKVNNKNTTTAVFNVKFEHISHFFSNVAVVEFEQVNIIWQ